MITIIPYCDKYTFDNNKIHTISQISSNIQKEYHILYLFTKLQILTKHVNVNRKNWWNTNSRNQQLEILKTQRGRLITNGSMKTHQHVYHKRNAIPWSLTHQIWAEAPLKRGLVPHADKETSHIASLNHKMIIIYR